MGAGSDRYSKSGSQMLGNAVLIQWAIPLVAHELRDGTKYAVSYELRDGTKYTVSYELRDGTKYAVSYELRDGTKYTVSYEGVTVTTATVNHKFVVTCGLHAQIVNSPLCSRPLTQ